MKQKSLKQLISAGKFDYVNENITEKNFPDDGQRGKVEIFHFNETLSSEEVIKRLDEKGYRPATAYELLNWAQKNWNGKDWVVALGSVWHRYGSRHVPYLRRLGSERNLYLDWSDDDWYDYCRFAAVRKLTSPSDSVSYSVPLNLEPLKQSVKDEMDKAIDKAFKDFSETFKQLGKE